jgi:Tfp pilus assembly protein PilN
MFIRINLLSPESIKKEERNEILLLGYAALVIVCVFCAANYAMKLSRFQKLETRLTAAQQELGKYEGIVKQVETLQATKKVLETKKNVINTLMAGRLLYPRFMEDLLSVLPSNIWFRTLTTALAADGKMGIVLDSDSLDNYSIADFVTALAANADFSNVELGTITTATTNRQQTSAFRLTFNYLKKSS